MNTSAAPQASENLFPPLPGEQSRQSHVERARPTKLETFAWILIVSAIALGVVCRFTNIDRYPFDRDEVATQFYLAARQPEFEYDKMRTKAEWLQRLGVQPSVSVTDIVHNLQDKSAEQMPVYYVVAHVWSKITGGTAYNLRLLSVLTGVSVIAATFLLAVELFETPIAGGFCAALVALSPFHVQFSQEVRPYELWALFVILSSLAVLRAERNPNWKNWLLYALATTTSLYTHALSMMVAVAHGCWALVEKRLSRGLMISLAVSISCFYPWYSLIAKHGTKSNWLDATTLTLQQHLIAIAAIAGRAFCNDYAKSITSLQIVVTLLLIAISLFTLLRFGSKRQSIFAASFLLVPTLCLLWFCCWHHAGATLIERYWTPLFVAIPLCAGGALSAAFNQAKFRIASMAVFSMLAIAGLVSSICLLPSPTSHVHGESTNALAEQINRYDHPVVLLDATVCRSMMLTTMLRDDAAVIRLKRREPLPGWISPPYLRVFISERHGRAILLPVLEETAPGQDIPFDSSLTTKDNLPGMNGQ